MALAVDIEAQLSALGQKRATQRVSDEQLRGDIRAAVAKAKEQGIAMTRVAELLGLDRTQLYRTYV